jgi:hypothetical protein
MSRPRQRAQLESGLKLNLNLLARRGFIKPGAVTGPRAICWTADGQQIAAAIIRADMSSADRGSFDIESWPTGKLYQWIVLEARPRHFGGRQWFFVCPYMNRRATVLWKPPGARTFACREWWGRQVAYVSQFLDRDNRAHRGQAKVRRRLCSIGGFDPDEWNLPPKPKWMRWRTYNRAVAKFDRYGANRPSGWCLRFSIVVGGEHGSNGESHDAAEREDEDGTDEAFEANHGLLTIAREMRWP